VVVRDQHRIDAGDVETMCGQPLLGPGARDPSVYQQLGAVRTYIDVVAVAAGLEGDDLHGDILRQDVVAAEVVLRS